MGIVRGELWSCRLGRIWRHGWRLVEEDQRRLTFLFEEGIKLSQLRRENNTENSNYNDKLYKYHRILLYIVNIVFACMAFRNMRFHLLNFMNITTFKHVNNYATVIIQLTTRSYMISIEHELLSVISSHPKAIGYSGQEVLMTTIHRGSLGFPLLANPHLCGNDVIIVIKDTATPTSVTIYTFISKVLVFSTRPCVTYCRREFFVNHDFYNCLAG